MTTTAAGTKARKPSRAERSERSAVIHTELDQAASLINSVHAKVLASVIEAKVWNIHRDVDGFSGLRDWLAHAFDFHTRVAADLAAIARCATKFVVLAEAATTGAARIDGVAAAVRRLDKTRALRVYARAPYREPVPSPFEPDTLCASPEHLIAQYCQHATVKEVHAHIDQLEAALDSGEELIDGLGQESLQRLDLIETDNGMWILDGLLSADTGAMFAKLLTTATPPPRQHETDDDGTLPAAANRRAEALHQMLTVYAADPKAPKRHGQTCTLNLTVDIDTLAGNDTDRVPTLEGKPVSLAKARLLACEAEVIPSMFNYSTGEAIELGRALRLPNTALRRKLELEQPEGCAWTGCGRPVQWTEAHHIQHWANGGKTVAENLILLCRFHHGRIHTNGWTIEKTAPGQALIVHHDGHEDTDPDPDMRCGCADYRTDTDLDLEFQGDVANVFPTGLYPEEWSEALGPDLEAAAEHAEQQQLEAEIKAARAKVRARFTAPTPAPATASPTPGTESPDTSAAVDEGENTSTTDTTRPEPELVSLPALPRPPRATTAGKEHQYQRSARIPSGFGSFLVPGHQTTKPPHRAPWTLRLHDSLRPDRPPQAPSHLFIADTPEAQPKTTPKPQVNPGPSSLMVAARLKPGRRPPQGHRTTLIPSRLVVADCPKPAQRPPQTRSALPGYPLALLSLPRTKLDRRLRCTKDVGRGS